MQHIEVKKQIVEARKRGISVAEISRTYNTPESTIYDLLKRERETGDITPRTHLRGCKPSYSEDDVAAIRALIETQRDITAGEIKEALGLGLCVSSICTIIRDKLGYRYKKRRYMPVSENDQM